MKTLSIITLILILFSCQTKKQEHIKKHLTTEKSEIYEVEVIKGLSFPIWIAGVWKNTAESNTNRFVIYSFNEGELTIRHGLNFQGEEQFIEPYKDYKLSEIQTDSSYLITMKKNNNTVEYEFRLQSVEWSNSKVLTYSIVEDGVVKREHLKSVQLVLTKI